MTSPLLPFAALLALGAGWGLSTPLVKIATSGGHAHFGLVFWQLAIGSVVLGLIQALRRRPLPLNRTTLAFCTMIAVLGTIIPNSAGYRAAAELPAGIMAIVISTVPMFAFPIAIALGMERFQALRFLGLALGLSGVALIALPGAALPDPAMALWLPVALIAPFCYGIEGNVVARWGTHGLGPIQVLFLASLIGTVLALPLALSTGQFFLPSWPPAVDDRAAIAVALMHSLIYAGYVALVGWAGSVFASQVSYLVTGFGVLWSMVILSERYALGVWIALALMLAGIALVQPRRGKAALAPAAPAGQSARRAGTGTR